MTRTTDLDDAEDKGVVVTTAPIIPTREAMVPFYGDEIPAALVQTPGDREPTVYVPIRPVCDFIGVDWSSQRQRIMRDPVLSAEIQGVVVTTTPSDDGRGGGPQSVLCLPLHFMHGWLFGINAARVKEPVRDALIRYQREVYAILAGAFAPERQSVQAALQRVEAIALAVAESSRAAAEGIGGAHLRIDKAGVVVRELAIEVASIKQRLGLSAQITAEQAQAVKVRVNEVAGLLGGVPGYGGRRKPHAAVWSEVYRRFGVPSYRELRQEQFAEVLAFLDEWADGMREMGVE